MAQPHNYTQSAQQNWQSADAAKTASQSAGMGSPFQTRHQSQGLNNPRQSSALPTESPLGSPQVMTLRDAATATGALNNQQSGGLPYQQGNWLTQKIQQAKQYLGGGAAAPQLQPQGPLVGIIDQGFAPGEHGHEMLKTIQQGNPDATVLLADSVGKGTWANDLTQFVDVAKASGQSQAVVNLSFDLTQKNPDGTTTTRSELTATERDALLYAQQNGVLVVTSAGNNGGAMSALEQASGRSDNLIVVGAAEGNQRAAYSSFGSGLDFLVSMDGRPEAGTSQAAAEMTQTITKLWAKNPGLAAHQVVQVLEATSTALNTTGWNPETGLGLLNARDALYYAAEVPPATEWLAGLGMTPETGKALVTDSPLGGFTWQGREGASASEQVNRRFPRLNRSQWKTVGHTALDVAGFVPVVGTVANLANAAWYAAEGDYVNAGISAAGAIPIAGSAANAARLTARGTQAARAGVRAANASRAAGRGGSGAANRVASGGRGGRSGNRPTSANRGRGGGNGRPSPRRDRPTSPSRSGRTNTRNTAPSPRQVRTNNPTNRTNHNRASIPTRRTQTSSGRGTTNRPTRTTAAHAARTPAQRANLRPQSTGRPIPSSRTNPRPSSNRQPALGNAKDRARTRDNAMESFDTGMEIALEMNAQNVAAGGSNAEPMPAWVEPTIGIASMLTGGRGRFRSTPTHMNVTGGGNPPRPGADRGNGLPRGTNGNGVGSRLPQRPPAGRGTTPTLRPTTVSPVDRRGAAAAQPRTFQQPQRVEQPARDRVLVSASAGAQRGGHNGSGIVASAATGGSGRGGLSRGQGQGAGASNQGGGNSTSSGGNSRGLGNGGSGQDLPPHGSGRSGMGREELPIVRGKHAFRPVFPYKSPQQRLQDTLNKYSSLPLDPLTRAFNARRIAMNRYQKETGHLRSDSKKRNMTVAVDSQGRAIQNGPLRGINETEHDKLKLALAALDRTLQQGTDIKPGNGDHINLRNMDPADVISDPAFLRPFPGGTVSPRQQYLPGLGKAADAERLAFEAELARDPSQKVISLGVSRPLCSSQNGDWDCVSYFRDAANSTQKTIIISAPDGTRVFQPKRKPRKPPGLSGWTPSF